MPAVTREQRALKELIEYAASARETNQPEWMDALADRVNEIITSEFPEESQRLVRHGDGFAFREVDA